jgi:thiol:disulfide interchange protein
MTSSSRPTAQEDDERFTEAAEWYVRHESEDGVSALNCREWEEWAADLGNSVKYDEVVALHRRVALLPRPSLPSAQEICADRVLLHRPLWSFWLVAGTKRFKHLALQQGVAAACCGGLILLGLLGGWFLGHHATESSVVAAASMDGEQVLPFSESTLERIRASGRPVFVNLRASWCPTCTANERTVLARNAVQQLMTRKHVAYLTGDWTLQDSTISAELRRFGRNGVPLYLLFSPGSNEPMILPQVLTEHVVLRELSRLPDPRASSS